MPSYGATFVELYSLVVPSSLSTLLLSPPPATGVQETYSVLRQRQDEVRKLENSCSSSAAKHKKNMDSILSTLAKQ